MFKLPKNILVFPEKNHFLVRCASRILLDDKSYADDLQVYEYPIKPKTETLVYAWGRGEHGALGHYLQKKKKMKGRLDVRFKTFKVPLRLQFGETHKVTDIAAGFGFSAFAVKSSNQNKVFGTGLNTDSQIGFQSSRQNFPLDILLAPVPIYLGLKKPEKTKIKAISAGRAHLVILTDLEGVFTLGNNAYGQCGRKIIENENYNGSRIVHRIPHFKDDQIVNVECGQDHTLFLTESGKVYSCGWGADGQTGLGHYDLQSHPQQLLGDIKDEKIIKISSKCDCVLAVNDKGDVFGWGNSEYSQLLDRSDSRQQLNTPVQLKKCQGFGRIVDVAAAGSFCMMLNDAGEVFTWGYGILGRGPDVLQSWDPEIIPPTLFGKNQFRTNAKVQSIYCGLHNCAAINNYGEIYSWGRNNNCCLGLLENKDQYFPLRVCIGIKAKKMALGVDHTLVLGHPF